MPIPLMGFANLAHMGAYHYMPSCFVKLSFQFKKKMVAADCGEKAPDSLNEGLVAARLDGVVSEESYAILTVGKNVNAPPDHRRGGPIHITN